MPIDASIPLQVHQFKVPTPLEQMSLQDLATRNQINQQTLQEKQLEVQKKNSLLQLMQTPGATDPQSGMLTPQGIAAVTKIDPQMGMTLGHQQQQLTLQNIAMQEKRSQLKSEILSSYVSLYDHYKQTLGDPALAEQKAREESRTMIDEGQKSGRYVGYGIGNDELTHDLPAPEIARRAVTIMGGKAPEPPKQEHTTAINPETGKLGLFNSVTGTFLKTAGGKYVEAPPNQMMFRAEMDTKGDYSKTGEDFLNTLPAQYRNLVKKTANYEVDPKTFSAQQGQRERMLSWASQYDPNFDQKEYNSRFQAVNKFNTGTQGNTVRSLNVAIQHMDTARQLGEALKNGDIQLFNKGAQAFAEQTGKTAPTNFEAVKDILADEVVKGVLGQAGTGEDRQKMASKIKTSSSPQQLSEALDSWTKLLGGQVSGLKTQYEASTGRKDFEKKLNPRTIEALSAVEKKGGGDWIERAMKANPGMSREEIEAEGKKRGKL